MRDLAKKALIQGLRDIAADLRPYIKGGFIPPDCLAEVAARLWFAKLILRTEPESSARAHLRALISEADRRVEALRARGPSLSVARAMVEAAVAALDEAVLFLER